MKSYTGKKIPVNADESHHFCQAYVMLCVERKRIPPKEFFGK
jgi:hypothetical protein